MRRIDLGCNFGQCLVPGDALPLALAARTDPFQRVQDAIRIVGIPHAGVALGTKASAGGDMLRIAFQLHDTPILDIGDCAVLDVTDVACQRNGLAFLHGHRPDVFAGQFIFHRIQHFWDSYCGGRGTRAELKECSAIHFKHDSLPDLEISLDDLSADQDGIA